MVYAAAWGAGSDESRMAAWPRNLGRTKLVERWGWTGDPRKNIPVEIYTNCDSVELLLNGRSLGEKRIADHLLPALLWAVPNEAGTVEVRGKKAGAVAARFELKSIGQAERLELSPDLKTLTNGGRQVSTIAVQVMDRNGNRVPDAAPAVTFEVTGAGRLIAVGNADLMDGARRHREPGEIVPGQGSGSSALGCRVRQDHGPRNIARIDGGRGDSQLGGGHASRFLQRSFASAILMVWGCSSVG